MSNPVKKLICDNLVVAINKSYHEASLMSLLTGSQQMAGMDIQRKYASKAIEILGSECFDVSSLAEEGITLLKIGDLDPNQEEKLITLDDWFVTEMKGILLPM